MFSQRVDVLVADLGIVAVDEDVLSVAELGRALWMRSPELLIPYLAAQTWLRRRLSEYLECGPGEIRFEDDESGTPAIVNPVTDLSFSLSHAGGMAALVVGFRKAVGIEIEPIDGDRVEVEEVRRRLSPTEKQSLLLSPDRDGAYVQHWVRQQALAKANRGVAEDIAAAGLSGASSVAAAGFEVTDINLGPGLVAAVATPVGTRFDVAIVVTETVPKRVATSAAIPGLSPQRLAAVGL